MRISLGSALVELDNNIVKLLLYQVVIIVIYLKTCKSESIIVWAVLKSFKRGFLNTLRTGSEE